MRLRKLYDAGELREKIQKSNEVVIYDAPMRGNVHKKREDGKSPVTDFRIVMELGKDFPVVSMVNYWADIRVMQDGTLRVDAQNKADVTRYSMRMTLEEWDYCTYVMQTEMRIFENICGSTAVKQA